jgi:hypothetical protein
MDRHHKLLHVLARALVEYSKISCIGRLLRIDLNVIIK